MRASRLLWVLAILLLSCFVCAQDYTAIRGNWHLTGSWDPSSSMSPRLALSIGVEGDEVFAMGGISVSCPNRVGVGAALSPRGRIAADGTFLLKGGDITVSGRVPDPGSEHWAGHYQFSASTAKGQCSAEGDFVATKLPALNGVYSGTLHLLDHSGDVTVTIEVSQGELLRLDYLYWLPVQATMQLSGSGEFPSEELKTAKFPPENKDEAAKAGQTGICCHIDGDHFIMVLAASSGEQMMLGASFVDATEQSLRVSLENMGSKNVAMGTLTRQ